MQYICGPVVDVTDEYMAQVCHHAYCVHVGAIVHWYCCIRDCIYSIALYIHIRNRYT